MFCCHQLTAIFPGLFYKSTSAHLLVTMVSVHILSLRIIKLSKNILMKNMKPFYSYMSKCIEDNYAVEQN